MTVSAKPARDLSRPDSPSLVTMRRNTEVTAGVYAFDGDATTLTAPGGKLARDGLRTGWHTHDLHQIDYAFHGTMEVETSAGRYLLPPALGAWIPAGLPHRTRIAIRVRTMSVFFDPLLVPDAGDRVRIVAVTPVVREMIIYGGRWPIGRATSTPAADGYFRTLAALVAEHLDIESPLCLPLSDDPLVAAAIIYTDLHLAQVTQAAVCRQVGASERTLRRRFLASTGLSWHGYLTQARLLRAMTMLAEATSTILDVSIEVGFESLSAFSRAFTQRTGQTPSAYRDRVTARRRPEPTEAFDEPAHGGPGRPAYRSQ
ncbi:helix-turn-helix domain-containing protein [Pseudofrankia asymbiotica]|nr:helix-turn-helix transcriptional regulator [Pseudofrankia asymbiotica]